MMLFDGAIRFCHQAKAAIERRDIVACSENCIKVQNIMSELMSSLDGEIISKELYSNLMGLYSFVHKRMISANIERNTGYIDESIEILGRLRQIWEETIQRAIEENGGKMPDMPPPGVRPEGNAARPAASANASTPSSSGQITAGAIAAMRNASQQAAQNRRGANAGISAYKSSGSGGSDDSPETTPEAPAEDAQKFPLPPGAATRTPPKGPPAPASKPPLSKLPGQAGPSRGAPPPPFKSPAGSSAPGAPRPAPKPPGTPPAGAPRPAPKGPPGAAPAAPARPPGAMPAAGAPKPPPPGGPRPPAAPGARPPAPPARPPAQRKP